MSDTSNRDRSFTQRLSLTFLGSAVVLLLAGCFALYLMTQLGGAVERVIDDILPKALDAMRLSEHSALLAASAPSLAHAPNPAATHEIETGLDQLQVEIDRNLSALEQTAKPERLVQVRRHVAMLSETLDGLKRATNERIALEQRRANALAHIRQAHSEFSYTIGPVVWGGSSLTQLFGKRTTRTDPAAVPELRDKHVQRLISLMALRNAYHGLIAGDASGEPAGSAQQRFAASLDRVRELAMRDGPDNQNTERLTVLGANLREIEANHPPGYTKDRNREFKAALLEVLAGAETKLTEHLEGALQTTETSIARLVAHAVRDMGYALDIKAEGSLLFTLLTAVGDADSPESVSALQKRFKRSRAIFLMSSGDFIEDALLQRNPILAQHIAHIERQLQVLGGGPENLFDIRRQQLTTQAEVELLLAKNRDLAAQLYLHVGQLVGEVQAQARSLSEQMQRARGTNKLLLALGFLIGLMLLVLIAFFSIRTLSRQDREIRQAAMVFDSTSEGIIIVDPHGHIVTVNQALTDASEYHRDELIGRHIRVLGSRQHRKVFFVQMLEALNETGRWQGEVHTRKKSGEAIPEWLTVNAIKDDQGRVIQYVAVFSDVAIVKQSLQQLNHLAHHDMLTGLPNRLLLQDRLEHAIHRGHRKGHRLAVLFLDLDRFKNLNDTLGHAAGDQLLRIFASRLSCQVREGDTVARLGGDEFMILLEDYRSSKEPQIVAQKLLDSLREAFDIQGHQLFVTASIGISLYPNDGDTVDELIRNSDAAMYRAKQRGKNRYHFYTVDLTAAARESLRLESSLRVALEKEEFVLYYQPKWNTRTGAISGVEALLRWQHPEQGVLGPNAFLAALEDCGVIREVGGWVLRTACEQAKAWQTQGLPPIQMSVNLSGYQIIEGELLQTVKAALADSALDPCYLELELTEGFIMRQPEEAIVLMNSLRSLGLSIAIDDFGTGYSSLSYLKQLPVQKLKIDRSFVRDIPIDPDDMAITSAIVALGHRLQMSIVAEGVETEEQLAFLLNEGCEEAQGYLFSMPLPAKKMRILLERGYFSPGRLALKAST